jgi:hypothetical protein
LAAELPPAAVEAAAQLNAHDEQARQADFAVRAIMAALAEQSPAHRRAHVTGAWAGVVRALLEVYEAEGAEPTVRDVVGVAIKQTNHVAEAFIEERKKRLPGLPHGR